VAGFDRPLTYPKKTSYGYKATWKRFHRIAEEHFPKTEKR